ncbi:MAG: arsenosugar biosynthesis radical SAM (seleno)protein ArsS [Planctomycetota bacterium]
MIQGAALPLPVLEREGFHTRFEHALRAAPVITTLQVNLGLLCNLACGHCHVDSSPQRRGDDENMSAETAERVLEWVERHPQITTVDLTGGSPEMNASFRPMVRRLRGRGLRVMDRHNPTVTTHTDRRTGMDYAWVPGFLAEHQVEVVASLPCYTAENVDKQRGRGSFDASVEGLLRLNDAGYGKDPGLRLNLVYNPGGPGLPPPQESLEADYKRELREHFGLEFNELWTITNMPIARWRRDLERQGQLEPYLRKLIDAFNPDAVEPLMCRHQVHIDSQGNLHDCDFNYAVGLRAPGFEGRKLWEVSIDELNERVIGTADHCYGCTAGAGSSCGGALV